MHGYSYKSSFTSYLVRDVTSLKKKKRTDYVLRIYICHFFLNVCVLLAVAGGVDACRHRLNLYNRGNAFARGVEEQIESSEHKRSVARAFGYPRHHNYGEAENICLYG